MKISLKYIVTLVLAVLFLFGCISEVDKDKGSLTIRGKWPDKTTRMIPADTDKIEILLYGHSSSTPSSLTIERKAGEASFEVEFTDLAEGEYSLSVSFYKGIENLATVYASPLMIKTGENIVEVAAGKLTAVEDAGRLPADGSEITPTGIYIIEWKDVGYENTSVTTTAQIFGEKYYNIYVGTSPDLGAADKKNTSPIFMPYFEFSFNPGTTYYWKVEAVNSAGTSESKVFTFNVRARKSMNEVLAGTNGGVTVSTDYYISSKEITQQEFEDIMGFNPSINKRSSYPVTNISWYDAVMFCNKLSERDGLNLYYSIANPIYNGTIGASNIISAVVNENSGYNGYRLPNIDEWQYAASGGKDETNSYMFSGSNTIDEVAWFLGNSSSMIQDVGLKKANKLGLYDMSGNAAEYTNTEIGTTAPQLVIKGGSFLQQDFECEIIGQLSGTKSDVSNSDVGFRVVRFK